MERGWADSTRRARHACWLDRTNRLGLHAGVPGAPNRSRHLVPLGATQAVGLLCGVIGVRWSSAIVPPEVLGIYGLLLSTQQLGATVTHQGLVKHVQRFWTEQTPLAPYWRALRGAMARPLVWLGAGLAGLLVGLNLTIDTPLSSVWWAWMLAVNLFAVAAQMAHGALQAEQRYWAGFAVAALGSVTRSFLPLLLVMTGGAVLAKLGAGFLGHTLVWAGGALWALRHAWARPDSLPEKIPPPQAMLRSFLWVGIFGWLAANAPRWVAAQVLSAEATGFFMLAVSLSMIVPAAVSLIGQSYSFPPLFAAGRQGADDATLQQMTTWTVATVLLLGQAGLLALAWVGPHLVGLIVAPRYAPAMDWVLAAGGATLAAVTGPFFCNLLIARDRERDCLRLTAASSALRLVLLGALAAAPGENTFRFGLALLPWPTVGLEYALARRWRRIGTRKEQP